MQFIEQEKNSWITDLSKTLSKNKNYSLQGMSIYVFGSYAKSPNGQDIDLLIIFDKNIITLLKALHIRKQIAHHLSKQTGKKSHICLLSKDEPEGRVFIKEENAKMIFSQEKDFLS